MTHSEELRVFADLLRQTARNSLPEEEIQELVVRGIIAVLEERSEQTGGDVEVNQLLYEAASQYPSEGVRKQAFQALSRLAQDGQKGAADQVYRLAIEQELLPARQVIISSGLKPTRPELRALFDWQTALESAAAYPEDDLGTLTRAFFSEASPGLQRRMIAIVMNTAQNNPAVSSLRNWAMIVSAVQSRSARSLEDLVSRFPSFSRSEHRLVIDQLDLLAQKGLSAARETLLLIFIHHEDKEARSIALTKGFYSENPERQAVFFFLAEDWTAYNTLDFNHSLLINAYETAGRPLRRRLLEHSRKTGQYEWLRNTDQGREIRWLDDLADADWELAVQRMIEGRQTADLWHLAQLAPPVWSAAILDQLIKSGWNPERDDERAGFANLAGLARACLEAPLNLRPKKTLHTTSRDLTCLVIHPEGRLLAGGSSEARIFTWDLPDGDLRPEALSAPAPVVRTIAFSPDGEMLASASGDNRIRIFRMQGGQIVKTLEGHTAMIRSLVFHPDGRMLFSAGFDSQVRFWRFPFGPQLRQVSAGPGEIFSLVAGHEGQYLIGGGTDGLVHVWTVPDGAEVRQMAGHRGTVTHLASSRTSELVVSCGRDGSICCWNYTSGGLVRRFEALISPVSACCLHPGDHTLVSGHQNGDIIPWNLSTGKPLGVLSGHRTAVSGLALTSDGSTLYSCDISGQLHSWDLRTFLTVRLRREVSRPGAVSTLQERLEHPDLSAAEKKWLTFTAELTRWRQRYDIELSEINTIHTGDFDIELS